MFLKTLRSSKSYFSYVFKRFLPYTLIMTFTLLAVNILVYSLAGDYRVGQALYLIDISIPTQIFMYIMPIILGCAQFGFLFTRNGSDFFGAMPSTRAEIFNSNVLSGLASIFIIIATNTLFFAVNMPLVHPDTMIAPTTYLWYFFYWFVAYAVTFAVTAFAATLSGTILAQLVLTFVTIITPGFFITAFQNIVCEDVSLVNNVTQYIGFDSADMLIKVLFAPYYPIQQLFFLMMGQEEFTGQFYDIQTWPMLICNVIMLFVFIFAGAKLLRRRKFELAGGTYTSENLYSAIKILAVFPFAFFMFRLLADVGEFWLFVLFMIVITVFYLLMDICLRKGLTKIKRSIVTYLISIAFSFLVFLGLAGIMAILQSSAIYTPKADIKALTLYLEPMGMNASHYVPYDKALIELTFDDEALINEFKTYDREKAAEGNEIVIMRVKIGGRTVLGRYRVSETFMNRVYTLIEADEDMIAKLDYSDERRSGLTMTSVSSQGSSYYGNYYTGSYSGFRIKNDTARAGMLKMLDDYNSALSIHARYDYTTAKAEVYLVADSSYSYGKTDYYYPNSNTNLTAHFVTYIDGVYYTESYIPYGEDEFKTFGEYLNLNASDFLKKEKDQVNVMISNGGAMVFTDDFLGNDAIFYNICRLYADDIAREVEENAFVPEAKDSVIVQLSNRHNEMVYATVSYEKTVKPLVEKYLAQSFETAKNFNYSDHEEFVIRLYINGSNNTRTDIAKYYTGESIRKLFESFASHFASDADLYTAQGHLPENLKGRPVVEIELRTGNLATAHLYAYLTEDIEAFLLDESSAFYSYNYYKINALNEYPVVKLTMDDMKINDPEIIDYFRPYIVSSSVNGYHYGTYKYEVYCVVTLEDPNGNTQTIEAWLPMNNEMAEVYETYVKAKAE